jgi:hypothetical protein
LTATVQIIEKNGSGGTATDKTSGTVRFKNADDATVDTSNPMVIPSSGSDWSYEKWLRLKVTVAPDTEISNIVAYTDGTSGFGTGVNLWAKAVTAFATPAEGTASTGYTDAFTYTSSAALTLGSSTYTGTGEKGDHLVLLLEVQSTATQGTLTGETLTISYDEI